MVGVSASGFLDDRVFVCALGPNFVCVCGRMFSFYTWIVAASHKVGVIPLTLCSFLFPQGVQIVRGFNRESGGRKRKKKAYKCSSEREMGEQR